MNKYRFIKISVLLITVLISGCIKNDIPYPTIPGEFLSFEVEHQASTPDINLEERTINIQLNELGDITKVKVLNYSITEDASITPALDSVINLSDSLVYTISTYQDYEWTIKASQSIERYFTIDQQVGNQLIDAETQRAKVFVAKEADLSKIMITGLKLGPEGATYSPDPSSIHDFTSDVNILVSYRDIEEEWTLSVEHGEGIPGLNDADILSFTLAEQVSMSETSIIKHTLGDIEGFIDVNVNTTELSALSIANIQLSAGASCELSSSETIDLSAPYTVVVTSGSGITKKWLIRAHTAEALKNRFFKEWHLDNKVWNPYLSSDPRYWCTGNEGVVTLKNSNTTQLDETTGGARLETVDLGFLGSIGGTPIAAGNIFIGDFKTNISQPALSVKFARPFTGRPRQVSCTYGYTPTVNEQKNRDDIPMKNGDMDKGHIWVKVLHLENETGEFDNVTHLPKGAVVIGEGEFVIEGEHAAGSEQTIALNYHKDQLDKAPTHLAIVATSSYYGEFFIGGVGSILTIENFDLKY
ncbi:MULTISPECIES: PCMD domain-containing protein [unclassified Carboxylicivirga]|uniref:PCMD domain-containing protein n=1 Tax=Carboxylicivirga TaxID=1628153 RepID=UPI003D34AA04